MTKSANNLAWLDLEMTGLYPDHDRIIEIATIVTDKDLNILAEGPVFAIHQDESLIEGMDEWNTTHHNQSGLVQRVRDTTVTEAHAEEATIEFLKEYIPEGKTPICGNSIYQDRRFLVRYMPKLEQFFHYRNIDVSTLKELAKRWAPKVYNGAQKKSQHIALEDIRDSINELIHYRQQFIQLPTKK